MEELTATSIKLDGRSKWRVPIFTFSLVLMTALCGCVGMPTSKRSQGIISEATLDDLVGLTREKVISDFGPPQMEVSEAGNTYLLYQGTWEWNDGILLPASWYLFVPFVIAGTSGALEDMRRGVVCYRIRINEQNVVTRVEEKRSDSTACVQEFWKEEELTRLRQNLQDRAEEGDLEAAKSLASVFSDKEQLVSMAEYNVDAAVYLALEFNNWKPLRILAQKDTNAREVLTKFIWTILKA